MSKDRSWMYSSIDSSNYIDGVLEFCKVIVEHQKRTGAIGFYCPCVRCVNVAKVDNVDVMREHILRRGFRPQYHVWIWHGKSRIYEGNTNSHNVPQHEDDVYDEPYGGAHGEDDDDDDMNFIVEKMEDIEEELGKVFLPITIRGILPKHVHYAIIELCSFFNLICNKVLDPLKLDALQVDVIATLCKFEMYFPPSFFDIMVHLIVHLVREIKLLGPLFLRWSYPFERNMGVLQNKVGNPAKPEESMIQGIVSDEVGNLISEYLASVKPIGLPTSHYEGRLEDKGTIGSKTITPARNTIQQAHLYVLHHVAEVHPFLDEHLNLLREENPSKGDTTLMHLHNKTFIDWFYNRVIIEQLEDVSESVKWLAFRPRDTVYKFEGYDVNGYTFWTNYQDQKSQCLENSGVSVLASSAFDTNDKLLYYGRIFEIWELDL